MKSEAKCQLKVSAQTQRGSLSLASLFPRTLLFFLCLILGTSADQDGQAIISSSQLNSNSHLRPFLEACDSITLQTHCTEEEYESNEDCLPQKTDNCDHSKELFCLSGVCLPNCHPHKETYDHIEGKCFRKVGSDCRQQGNGTTRTRLIPITQTFPSDESSQQHNTSSSTSIHGTKHDKERLSIDEEQHQQSAVIIAECEKNAICERGQCRCARNFTYDHNFNKCVLYAGYADYCNDSVNCDRKSDIMCRENQCQCKSPETQYFHLKRKRCYVHIRQVCSNGLQFCPDNSNCVKEKSSNNNNFLKTSPEYQETSFKGTHTKKQLELLYQQELFIGNEDDAETGDSEEEHFIGILGDGDDREFVCKCDKGYGSTRDKKYCLGLHGSRCNTLHRCNTERGLKCINGLCACEREIGNEQVYSKKFQTCITTIGSPCNLNGGEREADICSVGASCVNGKCVCDDGLSPSILPPLTTFSVPYSCLKGHGTSCKNNGSDIFSSKKYPFEPPCNHEIGLECDARDERCLCKDPNQFYDMSVQKCKNFLKIDQKTPVIHFAPPDDREYMFRRNCATNALRVQWAKVDGTVLSILVYLNSSIRFLSLLL